MYTATKPSSTHRVTVGDGWVALNTLIDTTNVFGRPAERHNF
jgi:hypothetical protein